MSLHDWTRVEAEIFHCFHAGWITDLGRALNGGLLPENYYSLSVEADAEFRGRKKSSIPVYRVQGDRIVAMLEIIVPGNKSSRQGFRTIVNNSRLLLENRIHITILDLFPPGRHDPSGIHAAIWEQISDDPFALP